jgi:hypothetical protein
MAKSGEKSKAVERKERVILPMVAGFATMALPMTGLVAALWAAPRPAPLRVAEEAVVEEETVEEKAEAGVIYVDLPEPLTVATVQNQARMQVSLAVLIKGSLLELAGMDGVITQKSKRIMAEMLIEAEQMVAEGADSDRLHRDLPERLRRVINGAIGTEDWPEPVAEVLITSMALQG